MTAAAIEELRRQLVERLPVLRRWTVGGWIWDWDFRPAQQPLRPLEDDDAPWEPLPDVDWHQLRLFGEKSYDGGASPFMTVHLESGAVYGLDLERTDAYLLNSSIPHFIETFLAFDAVLRGGADPSGLLARVRGIDPEAFPRGEWGAEAEHVIQALAEARAREE